MSEDRKDTPIEPVNYLGGVNVVDIGDIRVSRGKSRRPHSACEHRKLNYDNQERRIWCADCERDVDPFDAFEAFAKRSHAHIEKLKRREKSVEEAEQFTVRSRAVKALDEVWRGRNMVPACPSCGNGLIPEMFANGVKIKLGRDYALARLKPKT